jgi:hypothetical protein
MCPEIFLSAKKFQPPKMFARKIFSTTHCCRTILNLSLAEVLANLRLEDGKWYDYRGINHPTQPTASVENNIEVEVLSNHNLDLIQIRKVGHGDQAKANENVK